MADAYIWTSAYAQTFQIKLSQVQSKKSATRFCDTKLSRDESKPEVKLFGTAISSRHTEEDGRRPTFMGESNELFHGGRTDALPLPVGTHNKLVEMQVPVAVFFSKKVSRTCAVGLNGVAPGVPRHFIANCLEAVLHKLILAFWDGNLLAPQTRRCGAVGLPMSSCERADADKEQSFIQ